MLFFATDLSLRKQGGHRGFNIMKTYKETLEVRTDKRCQMIDITGQVEAVVEESGITEGTVTVFCPHTTAAITINENADPDVVHDVLMTMEEIVPKKRPGYRHSEGNSDAHVKSSIIGVSETIIISGAKMELGVWQGIYLCEFDGARNRQTIVSIIGA